MTGATGGGAAPDRLGRLARWVHDLEWDAVPPPVRREASLHALDAVGVAVRAASTEFGRGLLAGASAPWTPGAATAGAAVLGGPPCGDRRLAALVNGALVHGLEFDDTHVASVVHGSAVVLPAAVASVAPDQPTSALLVAYLAGWEVLVRLGLLAPGQLQRNGFQTAAVCGPIGAAATAARARGASATATRDAMAIATSLAGGLMAYAADGANVKRVHLGWAAQSGIAACDMAGWGVRGATGALDGRQGFVDSFVRSPVDWSSCETLGSEWEITRASFKRYPCCHFIHAYVDGVASLMDALGAWREGAGRIVCHVHPDVVPVIGIAAPEVRDLTGAQYSLRLCVALAAREGTVTIDGLERARGDPAAAGLAERVELRPAPWLPFPGEFGAALSVLGDGDGDGGGDGGGGAVVGEKELARPAADDLDQGGREDLVMAKFAANVEGVLDDRERDRVVEGLLTPERAPAGDWLGLLSRQAAGGAGSSG